jgi:Tol biopolymer transport system component
MRTCLTLALALTMTWSAPQGTREGSPEDLIGARQSCYRSPYADVLGIDLNTGKTTMYRKDMNEYNEVEGIFPNGEYTLVESSRDQLEQNSNYIDIWKLKLEADTRDFTRVTHCGEYRGFKASNPVVSPDGRRIAFQSARSKDPAGAGYGIFVLETR